MVKGQWRRWIHWSSTVLDRELVCPLWMQRSSTRHTVKVWSGSYIYITYNIHIEYWSPNSHRHRCTVHGGGEGGGVAHISLAFWTPNRSHNNIYKYNLPYAFHIYTHARVCTTQVSARQTCPRNASTVATRIPTTAPSARVLTASPAPTVRSWRPLTVRLTLRDIFIYSWISSGWKKLNSISNDIFRILVDEHQVSMVDIISTWFFSCLL